jgi:glycosyltransferase involved in cell wall biosynthesis
MENLLIPPHTGDLRITLLPPASLDGTRGGMRLVANAADGLAARGYRMEVIASERSPFPVKSPYIRVTMSSASRARALPVSVMRHLLRRKPHVIMTYGLETLLAAAAAKSVCRSGVRILPVFPDAPGVWITSPKDRRVLFFARLAFKRIKAAVAGSCEALHNIVEMMGIAPDKPALVYNPVIATGDFEQDVNAPLDHPWFAAGAPPLILGAGQLIERKGFSTLIRAFALLRKMHPARLMILGEGPQRSRLMNLASESGVADDVCLPGFVKNPYPFFKMAKVFSNPSLQEGFPNTLVEALAAGTPVITTDGRCGHGEILQGEKGGWIVPKGDPPQLAKVLIRALGSDRNSGELKTLAHRFGTTQAARGYAAVIRRLVRTDWHSS